MSAALPLGERGPVSGVGIGLREPHFEGLMNGLPTVPWVELLADNHFAAGGLVAARVAAIAERYPFTLHCVGMNLGGVEPMDRDYLDQVRSLADRTQPAWVSDHLCFTRHAGHHYHDLLPLPYSEEALRHVAQRVCQVQDHLGRRLVVENVSAYVSAAESVMGEAEFLAALVQETDCELLLDVNNLYVSQVNLGADARQFMSVVPRERVREIHLAGYEDKGSYLVDAHNNRVSDPVWDLFAEAASMWPEVPVLIEWDNAIPELDVLLAEAAKAERIRAGMRLSAA